jgi:hypothetical protein
LLPSSAYLVAIKACCLACLHLVGGLWLVMRHSAWGVGQETRRPTQCQELGQLSSVAMGVFVARENVRHSKSGIAHRGTTRIIYSQCNVGSISMPTHGNKLHCECA